MKRVLALLLTAVMLLTSALAAEGSRRTTVSWQTTPEGMTRYLSLLLGEDEVASSYGQSVAKALSAVMNAAQAAYQVDDDGRTVSVDASMRGIELLRASMHINRSSIETRLSLLPALVFTMPAEAGKDRLDWSLNIVYMAAVKQQLMQAAEKWLQSLPAETTHGVYGGNAYEGGDTCIAYSFDDAALTELVNALYVVLAPYLPNEAADLVASENSRVVQANDYAYQLRVVEAEGEVIGCSLNCYYGEELVLTVSANSQSPYEIVFSYMSGAQLVYDVLMIHVLETNDQRLRFTASWCHYPTDDTIAYPLVCGTRPAQNLYADVDLTLGKYCTIGMVKTGFEFEPEFWTEGMDPDRGLYSSVNIDFVLNKNGALDLSATTFAGEEECWTTVIKTEAAPAIDLEAAEDETMLDLIAPDTDAIRQLQALLNSDTLYKEFMVKLFKAVPPEALVFLLDSGY